MIKMAQFNILTIGERTGLGLELHDDTGAKALLPRREVEPDFNKGDRIEVFAHSIKDNVYQVTMDEPYLQSGEFGYLKVNEVNDIGAFLDWGIDKELFVPFAQQSNKMIPHKRYLVYLMVDEQTNRPLATSKIGRFIERDTIDLKEKQEVQLLICDSTPLGFEVIIDNKYKGMVYHNEVFRPLQTGERCTGYVNRLRDDNKIDVQLDRGGKGRVDPGVDLILEKLKSAGGYLNLHDDSSPQDIKHHLQMSKKTFKKAIGALYKQRKIQIKEDGIYLL